MKLTNTSAYHTATLRRIFTTTVRTLCAEQHELASHRAFGVKILVEEGRKRLHWEWEKDSVSTLRLRLPKLNGSEFIPLLRQQHGGGPVRTVSNPASPDFEMHWSGKPIDHAALQSTDVASAAQWAVISYFGWRVHVTAQEQALRLSVRAALVRAKVPQYVPLRIRKAPKEEEPRDIVVERYERVLELETKWRTKQKLAQTKLKKLRLKRRHYEKKLGKRNTNQEKP